MKLLALLSCLALVHGDVDLGVYPVRGVPHHREVLWNNLAQNFSPLSSPIAVDFSTNRLLIARYDNTDYKPAIFGIDTGAYQYVNGIENPQCITIDPETKDIYIGTADGIYKYDPVEDKAELVGAQGQDVWRIIFKGKLYYSQYKAKQIYTLVNGESLKFQSLDFKIRNFVIDNHDSFVYVGNHKLYVKKNGTLDVVEIKGVDPNVLATDSDGRAFFSTNDGVYSVDSVNGTTEKVVTLHYPRELAFDNKNNIIYLNKRDRKLYRLLPTVQ